MQLIGLNGFKGAGKDSTFEAIREVAASQVVIRRAFADKLKVLAAKALGFERTDKELIELMNSFKADARFNVQYREPKITSGFAWDLHDLTGRQYLQEFGSRAREVFHDTVWIDAVLPRSVVHLRREYTDTDILCITDVRYPNEAKRIQDLGGVVWEIGRPGYGSDGHSTEQSLSGELVDFVLINDGTLGDLEHKVKAVLTRD